MLAAQNVVGPLDGNFAETFVAEALGVGIVLDALEYFGEGEGRYLRLSATIRVPGVMSPVVARAFIKL